VRGGNDGRTARSRPERRPTSGKKGILVFPRSPIPS